MSAISTIEWTDRTWNPVRGCSVVSPGCVNCYAMKQAHRFSGPGGPYEGLTTLSARSGPQWTGAIRAVDAALLEPLAWRKPARVFVNSMSDLFHEGVPDAFIDKVFAVMALADRHTFQILTKRPERMRDYFARQLDAGGCLNETALESIAAAACEVSGAACAAHVIEDGSWPLRNVWLGVSVEDQAHADERIPPLLQTPAAVRFVSAEPLLGPVDLDGGTYDGPGWLRGWHVAGEHHPSCDGDCRECPVAVQVQHEHGLDWVIVGGESGPGARPFQIDWARGLVAQCTAAGVPVFVKQLGAVPASSADADLCGRRGPMMELRLKTASVFQVALKDRKGGNPDEWPDDLRVREFPR